MFLAMTMLILAVFYMIQDAMFLGVVQVVVYTGAVMMLFLFVLMLIGVDSAESLKETLRGQRVAAMVIGIGFGVLLSAGIGNAATGGFVGLTTANSQRQRRRAGRADLFALSVGVRADERVADHRGGRRDGARASGAFRAPQDAAGTSARTLPARSAPHPDAQPGRLRASERGRCGRAVARRIVLEVIGVPHIAEPRRGRQRDSVESSPVESVKGGAS